MRILAADTSTSVLTVAFTDGPNILSEHWVDCGRRHAERILHTAEAVLAAADASLGDVDALAVSSGPGSFTGLRVGLATWKGLALARGLPLVAVPTLDAMARLAPCRDGVVCPMLDARMGEVYGALFRYTGGHMEKASGDRVCPVEALLADCPDDTAVFGDGAARYRDRILAAAPGTVFLEVHTAPRAGAVAREALTLLERGAATDAAAVAPVYLRKSQPEEALAAEQRDRTEGAPRGGE